MLYPEDKRGRLPHPEWLFRGFRDAVMDCDLFDLPLTGYQFTWHKSLGTEHSIEQRIDRALASATWMSMFPNCKLLNLVAPFSDHSPILLYTNAVVTSKPSKRFRFENAWLREPELQKVVEKNWDSAHQSDVVERLKHCSVGLGRWGRQIFLGLRKEIKEAQEKIEALRYRPDSASVAAMKNEQSTLSSLLIQEEDFWKQRAKAFWLRDGDMNTRFFHATASARKKTNTIQKLLGNDGVWYDSEDDMCEIVKNYFTDLFEASDGVYDPVISTVLPRVTNSENALLTEPFTIEEFKKALFQMHPDKSPGPDGFNPVFFQRFWNIVGTDIFDGAIEWVKRLEFPAGLNDTNLVLIPKCSSPASMKDWRPIALCNVVYKILSKVLANRLKRVLPNIISRYQSAFVPGRSILDNVLIAFEIIHFMRRKSKGKQGNVALKIDISKAYDRLDWNYLRLIMLKLGFSSRWVDIIMMCVSSVSYHAVVNGRLVGPISPKRGLRQGDPLSPYLFIICAEGLSSLINHAVMENRYHGVRICRGAPVISHLLFADDSMFFFKAATDECSSMKNILDVYEYASGQAVNLNKSGIMFSNNVSMSDRTRLSNCLGVNQPLDTGRYLGLPSLIGRSKRSIFSFIRNRLWQRIQSWKGKNLTKAGKEILIKSVAQAIPSYCMSAFLLPVSLLDELQKMLNSFWWGSKSNGGRSVNWFSWDKLCNDKKEGGLGFRLFYCFNLAMLGKHGWRFIADPNALVSCIFRSKYFPRGDFLNAELGCNPSFIWRSIWCAQTVLRRGIRWKIGDGTKVNVWTENWLRDADNMKVQTPMILDMNNLTVHDLLIPGAREWDVELINDLFITRDVEEITSIPLCHGLSCDQRIWHFSNKGMYSVKSGYKVAMGFTSEQRNAIPGDWRKMWNLSVPPKFKFLAWRAARDCLPTRIRLQRRGIVVPGTCVFCHKDLENC